MAGSFLDTAAELVACHESFSSWAYDDHDGKPVRAPVGKLTIGFGFNIQDVGIPKDVARAWLRSELVSRYDQLKEFWWFSRANDPRQLAFLDMHYNLGHAKLLTFKKMLAAAEGSMWDRCAEEAQNSAWFNQVGRRGRNIVKILRTGVLDWSQIER